MMGGRVGCVDEKRIIYDDRKKNAFHFTMGGGGGGGELKLRGIGADSIEIICRRLIKMGLNIIVLKM